MENEDICLYPTIFHDGIGRYCNQLVTNLSIDYKISKYSYMSPFQLFEKINKQYKVIHCPHILVNKDMRINTKSIVTTIHDIGPIVLNNFYVSDLNSFQKGRIVYDFKNLEEGRHTLKLKSTELTMLFLLTQYRKNRTERSYFFGCTFLEY